jgi:hypothetical protein
MFRHVVAASALLLASGLAADKPETGRDGGKCQYDVHDPGLTRIEELMEPAPTKDPCGNPYTAPHPQL